jgi:dissimilatory sulfite reductase (desulfoviridin) alpha/beta subunit
MMRLALSGIAVACVETANRDIAVVKEIAPSAGEDTCIVMADTFAPEENRSPDIAS